MVIMEIVKDDVGTTLTFILTDADGTAVSLTDGTPVFKVATAPSATLQIDGTCTVTNAAGGICTYALIAGDTDTAGLYEGEVQVTYTSGNIFTWKLDGVRILEDLD